jgi:uncharacterized lipoprotein YehR (DUF1307 family)
MKRTMNRIVSLLLALAMVFALMACGKKEAPPRTISMKQLNLSVLDLLAP